MARFAKKNTLAWMDGWMVVVVGGGWVGGGGVKVRLDSIPPDHLHVRWWRLVRFRPVIRTHDAPHTHVAYAGKPRHNHPQGPRPLRVRADELKGPTR